jgi:hypothetical protein
MSPKMTVPVLTAGLAIAAFAITLSPATVAHAQAAVTECRIVGAISHRCYTFHSDATWREGLSDYHGASGG